MRLSGALQKKKGSELSYREAVRNSSNDETIAAKQVRMGLSLGSQEPPRWSLRGPGEHGSHVAALGSALTHRHAPGAVGSLLGPLWYQRELSKRPPNQCTLNADFRPRSRNSHS